MNEWIDRARRFVDVEMWRPDAPAPIRFLQLAWVIAEGFTRDQLLLRSHSLTYITMLSLIPLLALALSLVGMLGLRERVAGELYSRAATFGPDIERTLRELIENFDFGSLGAVGGSVLLATTILTVGNVERSFNHIWGIQRQRPWVRRVPDYLAVLLIAPVVLGVALSLGTTLQSPAAVQFLYRIPGFETLYASGLQQLPTLLFMLGFAFLYWFLPNTQVRGLSALLGGAVAGLLFLGLLWGYVTFSVGAARLGAIFGSLAQLPFFLIFVYMGWAVVLLGAEVAFAHQNLELYRRDVRGVPLGPASRERIGLAVALRVAGRFREGGAWTDDELADELQVPVRVVRGVLSELDAAGIVAVRDELERGAAWQLGRPAEAIAVADVLAALRGERTGEVGEGPLAKAVDETIAALDDRQRELSEHRSLADLLERCAST